MKAPPFLYARPTDLSDVFDLLAQYEDGAKLLAGGQSLMATLNMRLSLPDLLIDINAIDELSGIEVDGEVLRIGAMTRQSELEASPLVARHASLIAKAIPHVAHAAIRNRGTLGGSIAFADPAAELPACAVALGARFVIESAGGRRAVAAETFFEGLYATDLKPNEIVRAIEIPIAAPGTLYGFMEFARRHGDYALIGLAAAATLRDGRFEDARLVYFGAEDRPVLAKDVGTALTGRPNTAETRQAAAAVLDDILDPLEDLNATSEMRRQLAKVLTTRVLAGIGVQIQQR